MRQMHDPASVLREVRRELARMPLLLDIMVGNLDEAGARTRPAPTEWAPIEVLCHLRDEETEDFGARLRAVLDGRAEFAPIDPEGWVEERHYREAELGHVLDDFRDRRAKSLEFMESIVAEHLLAAIPHLRLGQLSGLDLLVAWVAHDRIHLRQLAGTLARLWANRWAPIQAQYAGPIPYSPGTVE